MNALIITIIMIIFNYLLGGDIKTTSDKYKLDITPAPFTFAIWGVIYGLLLYISIKHSKEMDNIIILYLVSCVLNVLWLYIYSKNIVLSSIILTLLSIVLFIILYKIVDSKSHIIIITFAIYSTWVLIASLLNSGSVFKYNNSMNFKDNIITSIISIYVSISLLLCILYKNVYITVSFISVVIWALIGIILK